MKIALVDDDPRALAQLEQYLTEQLGRETEMPTTAAGKRCWRTGGPAPSSWWCWISTWSAPQAWRWPGGCGPETDRCGWPSPPPATTSPARAMRWGPGLSPRKPFRPEGVRAMLERLDLEALERSRRLRLPDGSQVGAAEHPLRRLRRPPGGACTARMGTGPCGSSFAAVEPLLCAYPCFCGICRGVVVNFHQVAGRQEDVFLLKDGHPPAHQPPEVTGGAGGILRLPL